MGIISARNLEHPFETVQIKSFAMTIAISKFNYFKKSIRFVTMKFTSYLLFFTLIFSCSSESNSFIGNYETLKSTKTERWVNYLINNCIALGVTLELKKDSTYYISTCSYSANGNWIVKNDSLFLFENFNTQNIDNLKTKNKRNKIDRFLIKKKYFIQNIKSGNEDCTLKLEKIE